MDLLGHVDLVSERPMYRETVLVPDGTRYRAHARIEPEGRAALTLEGSDPERVLAYARQSRREGYRVAVCRVEPSGAASRIEVDA